MRNIDMVVAVCVLAVGVALALGCHGGGGPGPNTDTDTDTETPGECVVNDGIWLVEQVEDWVDGAGGPDAVRLSSGETLHIEPGHRQRDGWLIWIENSLQDGDLASFFVAPPATTVLDVTHPRAFTVRAVTDDPSKEAVEMLLSPSAAIHGLYRDHPCFDRFMALIEESRETGALLLFTEVEPFGIWDYWGVADVRRP